MPPPPLHSAFFQFRNAFDYLHSENVEYVLECGNVFIAKIQTLIESEQANPYKKYRNISIQMYLGTELFYLDRMFAMGNHVSNKTWHLYRQFISEALNLIHQLLDHGPAHSLHAVYDAFISELCGHTKLYALDYAGAQFLREFARALNSGTVDLHEQRDGLSILERLQAHSEMTAFGIEVGSSAFEGFCQRAAKLLEHEEEHIRLTGKLEAMMMGNHTDRLRENSPLRLLPLDMMRDIATEARSSISR